MSPPAARVPSPCIKICQMDPMLGLCIGCRRTLQEIADWLDMPVSAQLATLQRIAARRRQLGENPDQSPS